MTVVQPSDAAVPVFSRHDEADFGRGAGVLTDARLYRHLVVVIIWRQVVLQRCGSPLIKKINYQLLTKDFLKIVKTAK